MSKSKGNVLYADDLVSHFGVDAVRYYLLHEMPFAQDGTLTYELLIERINSDLANILGNLVNRTITMSQKYFDGNISAPVLKEAIDDELIQLALSTPDKVKEKMDKLRVSDAIDDIFILLRRSNKYIDETTPWVLGKDESGKKRLETVLYNLLESIRFSAVMLFPFMPETAESIFRQLNTSVKDWDSLKTFDGMKAGDTVGKGEILFARIDAEKKLNEIQESKEKDNNVNDEKNEKEYITIEDFDKIELKVGEILDCKKHPQADKLLVSSVKIGNETRQIVSGVAAYYTPEEMKGKRVIVVANLKPIKLRGEESRGMILFADNGERLEFVATNAPNGSIVK